MASVAVDPLAVVRAATLALLSAMDAAESATGEKRPVVAAVLGALEEGGVELPEFVRMML